MKKTIPSRDKLKDTLRLNIQKFSHDLVHYLSNPKIGSNISIQDKKVIEEIVAKIEFYLKSGFFRRDPILKVEVVVSFRQSRTRVRLTYFEEDTFKQVRDYLLREVKKHSRILGEESFNLEVEEVKNF